SRGAVGDPAAGGAAGVDAGLPRIPGRRPRRRDESRPVRGSPVPDRAHPRRGRAASPSALVAGPGGRAHRAVAVGPVALDHGAARLRAALGPAALTRVLVWPAAVTTQPSLPEGRWRSGHPDRRDRRVGTLAGARSTPLSARRRSAAPWRGKPGRPPCGPPWRRCWP